jgi:hypothetical protein
LEIHGVRVIDVAGSIRAGLGYAAADLELRRNAAYFVELYRLVGHRA